VPGGSDRSYGLHVARLAGVPEPVVDHAQEVMARWTQAAGSGEGETGKRGRAVKVVREAGEGLLLPADDKSVWQVVRALYSLDIANLTPVQALVILNDWQGRLRAGE
jgi:DNA mismatch repair protein MutS